MNSATIKKQRMSNTDILAGAFLGGIVPRCKHGNYSFHEPTEGADPLGLAYKGGMLAVRTRCNDVPFILVNGDSAVSRSGGWGGATLNAWSLRNMADKRGIASGTVSFATILTAMNDTRARHERVDARDMLRAIERGALEVIDYSEDETVYSRNAPDKQKVNYDGSCRELADAPLPESAGWTTQWNPAKKETYSGSGQFDESTDGKEWWTSHRPGYVLLKYQPAPTAGPSAPGYAVYEEPAEPENYKSKRFEIRGGAEGFVADAFNFHTDEDTYRVSGRLDKDAAFKQAKARCKALNDTRKPPAMYLLCGMDDGSYFISSQPDRPRTIDAAMRAFMPDIVQKAHEQGIKVKRQGEWYFIPQHFTEVPKHNTLAALDRAMRVQGYRSLNRESALPRPNNEGNLHLVTRLWERGKINRKTNDSEQMLVYGRVRHDAGHLPRGWGNRRRGDHPPIELRDFVYLAVRNRSLRSWSAPEGVGRVD